ncbi:hypothetical protein Z043_108868 [Scleropages formosus]|uniref:Rho guanine nucleotide exchange factor 10-like protein n=1 Tax=Scleropages formosus TaxID=113540 RepID=A0A0P7UDE7_SCLFO|nr:hypothetical protein Z043_108868 [Scleropages formosus]
MGPPRLFQDLQELRHDLTVVEEITLLAGTLQGTYQNLNTTVGQDWCLALQRLIRLKEEEIQNANRCRLRLLVPGKPDSDGVQVWRARESIRRQSGQLHGAQIAARSGAANPVILHQLTFAVQDPRAAVLRVKPYASPSREDWPKTQGRKGTNVMQSIPCLFTQCSRISFHPFCVLGEENTPGWVCAEDDGKTKAPFWCPLLACRVPVFSMKSQDQKLEAALHNPVQCALLGFSAASTSLPQGYLWVASGGGTTHGQVEIFSLNRPTPRAVKSFQLGAPVLCLEYVSEPGPPEEGEVGVGVDEGPAPIGSTICVGLYDGRILVYGSVDTAAQCLMTFRNPEGSSVLCLKHLSNLLFAGLTDGRVLVYSRKNGDELWDAESCRHVSVGSEPIRTLLALEDCVWASCANRVVVIEPSNLGTQSFEAHPDPRVSVAHMSRAGGGVWMAFSEGSSIRLFHTETQEHLQEINISVRSAFLNPGKCPRGEKCGPLERAPRSAKQTPQTTSQEMVRVTSLLVCQGMLWVGTAQGVIVALPVPKLEGIPKITGKGMTSLNAHGGPVDFLVATSSLLSPSLLKRDSVVDGQDSASCGEERTDSSSQESLQQGSGSPQQEGKAKGVLLQYRLRSTSQLPGKVLSAQPEGSSGSSLESLEHSLEDGSIYELSDDPEVWVRGRSTSRDASRRDKVTSAAVISGGRGFRRLGSRSSVDGGAADDSVLMVWQLPITA